jgi:hypothetical protein
MCDQPWDVKKLRHRKGLLGSAGTARLSSSGSNDEWWGEET